MRDDFHRAVELIHPLRQVAEGDQFRLRDIADLIFVWLAHIQQQELVSAVQLGFHLNRIDLAFFDARLGGRLMLREFRRIPDNRSAW